MKTIKLLTTYRDLEVGWIGEMGDEKADQLVELKRAEYVSKPKTYKNKMMLSKPYPCPQCEKGYKLASGLQHHLKVKH